MSNTTKKKIISLEVRDEYILGSGVAIGARGSFDSSVLRVKFDDNWLGLNIYATWTDALGNVGDQTIVTVLDLVDGEANTYDIPVSAFATQHAGTVKLALSGYVIGGEAGAEVESLLNTVSGAFRVLESSATLLDSKKTAPTVAEQLLAAMNEHITEVNGEIDALEKSFENQMSEHSQEMNARTTEFEQKVNAAEDTRKTAEQERVSAEEIRQENARALADAERSRLQAEDSRVFAEQDRVASEKQRVENENARIEITDAMREALENLITLQEQYIAKGATV